MISNPQGIIFLAQIISYGKTWSFFFGRFYGNKSILSQIINSFFFHFKFRVFFNWFPFFCGATVGLKKVLSALLHFHKHLAFEATRWRSWIINSLVKNFTQNNLIQNEWFICSKSLPFNFSLWKRFFFLFIYDYKMKKVNVFPTVSTLCDKLNVTFVHHHQFIFN